MLSFIFNRKPKDKDLLRAIRKSHLSGNFAEQALSMIDKGANANAVDAESGWTALHLAAGREQKSIVERLIDNGADVNVASGEEETTPLSILLGSAKNDPVDMVKYLLRKGADPNKGESALISAALFGHWESFKELLKAGADPKATDDEGYTALHYVAREDDPELALMLLDKGADLNARNAKGKTPADYIQWLGHDSKADFLRKWETEPDAPQRLRILKDVATAIDQARSMKAPRPVKAGNAAPRY
jgi:ankyrin repeat protein